MYVRLPQTVQIKTGWFLKGYSQGLGGARGMPEVPTEEAVVNVARNILKIACEDGEISEEQLRYECGLLVGYLLRTVN